MKKSIVLVSVFLALIIVLSCVCVACNDSSSNSQTAEETIVMRNVNRVKNACKDPSSFVARGTCYTWIKYNDDGSKKYEISRIVFDAKNSFGAYSGTSIAYVDGGSIYTDSETTSDGKFSYSMCESKMNIAIKDYNNGTLESTEKLYFVSADRINSLL